MSEFPEVPISIIGAVPPSEFLSSELESFARPDQSDASNMDTRLILERLNALTERIDVIGQQQQWIIDQVKGAFAMFSQNPLTRGAMKRMTGQ